MLVRYLKLQLFFLVCGAVGPAFLIFYFLEGRASGAAWMFYLGLGFTVFDFVAPLAWTFMGARSAAKHAELERDGVLALAQITGLTETGTTINDQPLVKVNLHISGPGFAPFDSQDRVLAGLSRVGNLTARKVVVVVNPNTQEYRIDWERSALVNGLVPAQYNVAEDNRTYDLSGQAGPLMEILQIYKANNLSTGGHKDLRSNPAVRQQVLAVVRRAAERQAAVAQPAPVAAPQPSIGERLAELETLRTGGALTEQEYTGRRAQIISEI